MKTNVIEITVTGETQTGKSAILREIKDHLESLNLGVIFGSREHRNNPPDNFEQSQRHELPKMDGTIVVLSEENKVR